MNKKNYLIIMFVLNVFLVILLFKVGSDSRINLTKINCESDYQQLQQQNAAAKKLILYKLIEDNIKIKSGTILFDSDNKQYKFDDFFKKDTTKFFVFIPSKGCHSCLNNIKDEIMKYGSKNFLENIIFLTSFIKDDEFIQLENDYEINIYSLKNNYLGFLSERENFYFIFMLDSNLNTSRFHIFDGNLSSFTIQYFRYLKSNYYNKNQEKEFLSNN